MAAPSKFTKRIQFYQRLRYKEVGQLGSTLGKRGGIGALPGRHGQHTRVPGWGDSFFHRECDYIIGLCRLRVSLHFYAHPCCWLARLVRLISLVARSL